MNKKILPQQDRLLVFFGHNRNDVAVIRRLQSFNKINIKVLGFTYRRDGETGESPATWNNKDLGYVEHAKFAGRILALAKSLFTIIKNRKNMIQADIFYARNLDMFLVAWFSKLLIPATKSKMVYEVLDVHESLIKKTPLSAAMRWVERRILNRCDLLVISSPGFIDNYFIPIQNYRRNYYLLENKLYFDGKPLDRPKHEYAESTDNRPIRLVWAGILRCQKTLDVMKYISKKMGDDLEINIWGRISTFLIPDFEAQIKDLQNIQYHGEYSWPDELSRVYNRADLCWSQELSWRGGNSDWLIPNRVYEASYFGVMSLAVSGTQTGKYVEEHNIGYTLPGVSYENIFRLINNLSLSEIRHKRNELLAMRDDFFLSSKSDVGDLISQLYN